MMDQKFEQYLQEWYMPTINRVLKRRIKNYTENCKMSEVITPEQYNEYHRLYMEEDDLEARDILIYSQLKLVCYYAKKFHYTTNGTNLLPEDLVGFANEVLINLISGYDSSFNTSFPSYIRNFLDSYLQAHLKEYGNVVNISHNVLYEVSKAKRLFSFFENKYGHSPYHGDKMVIDTKIKRKKVKLRVTYAIDNKKIFIEQLQDDGTWKKKKPIKIHPQYEFVSGTTNSSQEEDGKKLSILDVVPSDYNSEMFLNQDNENKTLIMQEIENTVNSMTERDQQLIRLMESRTPSKDIPKVLKPNPNNVNETKRLKRTSKNYIYIEIHDNGICEKLTFDVTCNYHVNKKEEGEYCSTYLEPITHKGMNVFRHLANDTYKFKIKKDAKYTITHESQGKVKDLFFDVKNGMLTFNVKYSYGNIFSTQTYSDKKRKVINKLRKNLFKLKYNED